MEPSKTKNGTLLKLAPVPPEPSRCKSTIQRVETLPSWQEALEYRRTGGGEAAIAAYAARHQGFAHVLARLERAEAAERGEE